MPVEWTPHRFSGGTLALDAANTVVLRNDPERSFDRFDDPVEISRFAAAASEFRADELGGRKLAASDPHAIQHRVIAVREATDRLFRSGAENGGLDMALLGELTAKCAPALRGRAEKVAMVGKPFGDPVRPLAFETALALSALSLLSPERLERIRICQSCGWLFVDQSRNRSRLWCDMAVCGNRQKAKRHYRRRRGQGEEIHVQD